MPRQFVPYTLVLLLGCTFDQESAEIPSVDDPAVGLVSETMSTSRGACAADLDEDGDGAADERVTYLLDSTGRTLRSTGVRGDGAPGLREIYAYDNAGRVVRFDWGIADGPPSSTLEWGYDAVGHLLWNRESHESTVRMTEYA